MMNNLGPTTHSVMFKIPGSIGPKSLVFSIFGMSSKSNCKHYMYPHHKQDYFVQRDKVEIN